MPPEKTFETERKRQMKTAKMKKILAVLLAAMSAASLAACGGNETASSGASSSGGAAAPGVGEGAETAAEDFVCPDYDNLNFDGDYITCKETTTLEIGCYQDPLITDYDDNKMTNYLEDLLNIEIEWELYPAADALSKIRVMIFSGTELADILGVPYARVKIGFDVICLAITAAVTGIFLGQVKGLGAGTILAAFTMGKAVGMIGNWMDARVRFAPRILCRLLAPEPGKTGRWHAENGRQA